MPRKPSVTVQMADAPEALPTFDEIIGSLPPRKPQEPPHRQPDSPDLPDPASPGNEPYPGYPDKDPPDPDEDPARLPDDLPTDHEPRDPGHPDPAPAHFRYESRIVIVDAWQYPGHLKDAPDWVDRNWAAYFDSWDPIRKLEPGPALRVPSSLGQERICRAGDYVAQQEVRLATGVPPEIRLEVWEKEQFQRLFIPVETTEEPVPDPAPLAA